jgi:hypothetical protein
MIAYLLGRPAAAPDPDALDVAEWRLLAANPARAEVLRALLDDLPADMACDIVVRKITPKTPEEFRERLFDHDRLPDAVRQFQKEQDAKRQRQRAR